MGGLAFKHLSLVRVQREDVPATVAHVVNTLRVPGFTLDYAMNHLMGSTGKKASSGDVDFAMNTHRPRFVGEADKPVFNKHEVLARLLAVLPKTHVNTTTFKMGNLMSAWPVAGDPSKGWVQVDFVFGKADWLLFTHYSPGEESHYKGVFVSQAFGVLAKMRKEWEKHDQDGERMARVGLHLSLELGLFRKWEARRKPGMGASECTADFFETRFPDAPRLSRLGYVDDPDTVVEMLMGRGVRHHDVNTFEKFVAWMKTNRTPEDFVQFKERVLESLGRSGAKHEYDMEEVARDPMWY